MSTWKTVIAGVLVFLFAGAMLFAEGDGQDDDRKKPAGRGRLKNVWGRVEELNKKMTLLAVKVETEDGDKIMIFNINEDTKIRKAEKVKSVKDLRKGMEVIVFYAPKGEDEKHDTALGVRIRDDVDRRPRRRPRRRP